VEVVREKTLDEIRSWREQMLAKLLKVIRGGQDRLERFFPTSEFILKSVF
jgi:hypothetical protein